MSCTFNQDCSDNKVCQDGKCVDPPGTSSPWASVAIVTGLALFWVVIYYFVVKKLREQSQDSYESTSLNIKKIAIYALYIIAGISIAYTIYALFVKKSCGTPDKDCPPNQSLRCGKSTDYAWTCQESSNKCNAPDPIFCPDGDPGSCYKCPTAWTHGAAYFKCDSESGQIVKNTDPRSKDGCFVICNEGLDPDYAHNACVNPNVPECGATKSCDKDHKCVDSKCVPKICTDIGETCATCQTCNKTTGKCDVIPNCCDGVTCKDWENCDNGKCKLLPGMCETNNDCPSDACDTDTHKCQDTPHYHPGVNGCTEGFGRWSWSRDDVHPNGYWVCQCINQTIYDPGQGCSPRMANTLCSVAHTIGVTADTVPSFSDYKWGKDQVLITPGSENFPIPIGGGICPCQTGFGGSQCTQDHTCSGNGAWNESTGKCVCNTFRAPTCSQNVNELSYLGPDCAKQCCIDPNLCEYDSSDAFCFQVGNPCCDGTTVQKHSGSHGYFYCG